MTCSRSRVVLYNPRNAERPKTVLPLSLLALGAALDGTADFVIVDANVERDPLGALLRTVRQTDPILVGMTVMPGPQLKQAVPYARELRSTFPECPIVWGGYFPTQHWDTVLRSGLVDWVVRGHGEHVFRSLVESLARGADPRNLAGLAYVDDAGDPRSNQLAAVPNPNDEPGFPYDAVDLERYVRPTVLGSRTLSHNSSYGCPFFCNFCAVVNMVEGRWLAQSAERTAAVASRLVQLAHINAIEFFDNNFFVRRDRCHEFAVRVEGLGLAWWGEGRIDTLLKFDEATWRAMASSGLKMIFMGAESGSDTTLKLMHKGGTMSTDKTMQIAELMRAHGIVPEFSFVMGNPPDPESDIDGTIAFIRRLKRVNPASEIIMYMYTPVPLAGGLYDSAQAAGFSFPETLDEWCSPRWEEFSQRRSTTMPWLDDGLRRKVRNFERVLNAYYPTTTNPSLRGARRALLRAAGGWRWLSRRYEAPVELRALHRVLAYQRPETSGF